MQFCFWGKIVRLQVGNKNFFEKILPIFNIKCPFTSEGCLKIFDSIPAQKTKKCPLSSEGGDKLIVNVL